MNIFDSSAQSFAQITSKDQVSNLKAFCKAITKDPAFQVNAFYNFFNIPEQYRAENFEHRQSTISVRSTSRMVPSDELRHRATITNDGSEDSWREYHTEDTKSFSPFFIVSVKHLNYNKDGGFFVYSFEVKSMIDDHVKFGFDKRYSEFLTFASVLNSNCRVRCPPLPKKMLTKDEDKMKVRGEFLCEWLQIVLNERMFFCGDLFDFVEMPKDLQSEYLSVHPLGFLYNEVKLKISIPSFEVAKSMDNKDSFILFRISVKVVSQKMQELASSYHVNRRYREFVNLHNTLKKKFKNYKKPLPEIPPKLHFGNNEKRQYKLENYLRLIVEYPDIFDCVCFRKFLGVEPKKFNSMRIRDNAIYTSDTGTQHTMTLL